MSDLTIPLQWGSFILSVSGFPSLSDCQSVVSNFKYIVLHTTCKCIYIYIQYMFSSSVFIEFAIE